MRTFTQKNQEVTEWNDPDRFFAGIRLFKKGKSKRIIFLNPEPKTLWGTGDSEMTRYTPYCHKAKVCSSLNDLEKVVEDLLRYSF